MHGFAKPHFNKKSDLVFIYFYSTFNPTLSLLRKIKKYAYEDFSPFFELKLSLK